jgi:hypothetical protein
MLRTRRRVWSLSLVAVLLVAAVGVLALDHGTKPAPAPAPRPKPRATPSASQSFHSRPDLKPPAMQVTGATAGPVFLAPKRRSGQGGPAIVDGHGQLIWFRPTPKGVVADDLRVQRYRGKAVLTWWQGKTSTNGYGQGSWVLADERYREIARVRAGHGLHGDLHDMQLTPRGTAYITIYNKVDADLAPVGSPPGGEAMDSIIQEVDVRTGKVLFEWHSIGHVALGESHAVGPKDHRLPYDYFHINSIEEDADGNLLVSARNTWALYKIDRRSGDVLWRLGGRRSDFALGADVRFAWQHDARLQGDGTITLFDNEATPKVGDASRILTLKLDEAKRTVTLANARTHPDKVLAIAEGNMQLLPGGAAMVGWGIGRRVSELGPDGELRFDIRLPGDTDTYRALRFAWDGRPTEKPALSLERDGDRVTAYASWNGATAVTRWQLLAGSLRSDMHVVATADRDGFETALHAVSPSEYVAVRALHGNRVLATSRIAS